MNDGKKFYSLESEIEIILEKSKCLLLIKSSILIQTCLLMEIMVYRFYPSVLYGRRTLSLFDMAPCALQASSGHLKIYHKTLILAFESKQYAVSLNCTFYFFLAHSDLHTRLGI